MHAHKGAIFLFKVDIHCAEENLFLNSRRYLRTLQIAPVQPELQVHVFGFVQVPFTQVGEQIACNRKNDFVVRIEFVFIGLLTEIADISSPTGITSASVRINTDSIHARGRTNGCK